MVIIFCYNNNSINIIIIIIRPVLVSPWVPAPAVADLEVRRGAGSSAVAGFADGIEPACPFWAHNNSDNNNNYSNSSSDNNNNSDSSSSNNNHSNNSSMNNNNSHNSSRNNDNSNNHILYNNNNSGNNDILYTFL